MEGGHQGQSSRQREQDLAQRAQTTQGPHSVVSYTYTPVVPSQVAVANTTDMAVQRDNTLHQGHRHTQLSLWDVADQDLTLDQSGAGEVVGQPEGQVARGHSGDQHQDHSLARRNMNIRDWDAHDTFQAVLLEDDAALLTTYSEKDDHWVST